MRARSATSILVLSATLCAVPRPEAAPAWEVYPLTANVLMPGAGDGAWARVGIKPRFNTAGFSEFQGNTWVNTHADSLLALRYVRAVGADGSGGLWVGDSESVTVLKEGSLKAFGKADLPRPDSLKDSSLIIAGLGGDPSAMWAAARYKHRSIDDPKYLLLRHDGRAWSFGTDPALNGRLPQVMHGDGKGGLWILTLKACFCYSEPSLIHCDERMACTGLPRAGEEYLYSWEDMAADGPNRVWAVLRNALYHWDGTKWSVYDSTKLGAGTLVNAVAAANGEVWVGTSKGLLHARGDAWENIALPDSSLSGKAIRSVMIAPGGALWVLGTGKSARLREAVPVANLHRAIAAPGRAGRLPFGTLAPTVAGRIISDARGRLFAAPLSLHGAAFLPR